MAFGGLGVVDQAFDEPVDPVHLPGHIFGKGFLHLLVLPPGADQGGEGADGHEGVADLMGDARGDPGQGLAFLLVEFRLLHPFRLGHIRYA